jgi:hypothetical protein
MKKLSNQEMKKIAKSTLALVLAGTFTFSPIAMAQDNTSDEYKTVDLQTVSPEEIDDAKTQVEELAETNPSLIPGDFFYFAKIALEKIRLAFTFDNAKEAELLATYAAERLGEAGKLFAEGKEAEALELIEAAVKYMENSQDIVDDENSNDEGEEEETNTDDNTDSETGEQDTDSEEAKEEDADSDSEAGDVVAEDPSDEEDAEEATDEVIENPYEEIEGMLRQNIIALKAAMEHVGNDKARAALQRNIDKTYAKMAKKLAKLEEKYAEMPEEDEKTEPTEPVVVDPVETDLQPADKVEEPTDVPTEEPAETMPADDDTVVPVVVPVKTVKEQAKQQRKAEKAAVKQERKAAHQERKAAKHQEKQQKKEAKDQAKQERSAKKSERKHDANGKEQHKDHGKGNGKN